MQGREGAVQRIFLTFVQAPFPLSLYLPFSRFFHRRCSQAMTTLLSNPPARLTRTFRSESCNTCQPATDNDALTPRVVRHPVIKLFTMGFRPG